MKLLRLSSFTLLSGVGWCIDFAIFNVLVSRGFTSFAANLSSASVAVTFVLIIARRWIFRHHVETLPMTIFWYAAWNAAAIPAASLGLKAVSAGLLQVDWGQAKLLAGTGLDHPIAYRMLIANFAKIVITPFTMYANFVATGYIIERRMRFY